MVVTSYAESWLAISAKEGVVAADAGVGAARGSVLVLAEDRDHLEGVVLPDLVVLGELPGRLDGARAHVGGDGHDIRLVEAAAVVVRAVVVPVDASGDVVRAGLGAGVQVLVHEGALRAHVDGKLEVVGRGDVVAMTPGHWNARVVGDARAAVFGLRGLDVREGHAVEARHGVLSVELPDGVEELVLHLPARVVVAVGDQLAAESEVEEERLGARVGLERIGLGQIGLAARPGDVVRTAEEAREGQHGGELGETLHDRSP